MNKVDNLPALVALIRLNIDTILFDTADKTNEHISEVTLIAKHYDYTVEYLHNGDIKYNYTWSGLE